MKFDVIHTHDYFPRVLRRLLRYRAWTHTFHGYEGYPLDQLAITSRQEVAKMVDYSFGVGAYIEKWYGTKLDNVFYGAADAPETQSPIQLSWDIIFYGRHEEDTGFRDYLEGFKLIQKHQPKARLLVLGSGSLEQWAKQMTADHNLNVDFLGWKPDILPYLAASNVAFVSGYLAMLEAELLGKFIISTYQTPLKRDYLECHPMAHTFSVTSEPQGICDAYLSFNHKASAEALAEAKRWAEEQTWDKIAVIYEQGYSTALKRRD